MRRFLGLFSVGACMAFLLGGRGTAGVPHAFVSNDRLYVDGQVVPYWFGGEVQYFRARGGAGRNVDAAVVDKLWDRLIDRVLEAKMNAVSVYVPWDFHEVREGVFDFDGRLDLDGDGKPDYPSRNLRGFLTKLRDRGIRNIMVRPGPYINAEWGPTGFGAVPLWFLNEHPEALSTAIMADKPRTVAFASPVFRRYAERWLSELYQQVLKDFIGPHRPVVFLQIDNETNYFWDSIYVRDYSETAVARYKSFLRRKYHDSIEDLRNAYESRQVDFDTIRPPKSPDERFYTGLAWHYDWYQFHDEEILDYHRFLRKAWERIGIREPDVLFTSCDSFNAPPHGLLPRLDYRQRAKLTLSTMNIYPKTKGTQQESTLNEPMKAAHDAQLMLASHRQFYRSAGDWLMSTETVGGWFPKWAEVSLATRQHTYGSLLGSGVKAMTIYYFHEGWNWDGRELYDSELQFDAPLDKDMNRRPSFEVIQSLGSALQSGLGQDLIEQRVAVSPILIAHDTTTQYPLSVMPNALEAASVESAAVYGAFREAGFVPELGYLDEMMQVDLKRFKIIVWISPGYASKESSENLKRFVADGGTLIVIGDTEFDRSLPAAIHWPEDFMRAWNSDDYTRKDNARQILNQIIQTLTDASLTTQYEIRSGDGEPFVHAWFSTDGSGRAFLYVENFLRTQRVVHLTLSQDFLPVIQGNSTATSAIQLRRRWSGSPDIPDIIDGTINSRTLTIPVSADGIDIWSIEKR